MDLGHDRVAFSRESTFGVSDGDWYACFTGPLNNTLRFDEVSTQMFNRVNYRVVRTKQVCAITLSKNFNGGVIDRILVQSALTGGTFQIQTDDRRFIKAFVKRISISSRKQELVTLECEIEATVGFTTSITPTIEGDGAVGHTDTSISRFNDNTIYWDMTLENNNVHSFDTNGIANKVLVMDTRAMAQQATYYLTEDDNFNVDLVNAATQDLTLTFANFSFILTGGHADFQDPVKTTGYDDLIRTYVYRDLFINSFSY